MICSDTLLHRFLKTAEKDIIMSLSGTAESTINLFDLSTYLLINDKKSSNLFYVKEKNQASEQAILKICDFKNSSSFHYNSTLLSERRGQRLSTSLSI